MNAIVDPGESRWAGGSIVRNEGRKRANRRTALWLFVLAVVFFVLGVIKYRVFGQ